MGSTWSAAYSSTVLFCQKACTQLLTVVKKRFVPISLAATREVGLGLAGSSITQKGLVSSAGELRVEQWLSLSLFQPFN
jgi:hypothetical protein